MSAISDRMRLYARELEAAAEAIEGLERERDEALRVAARFSEALDRQKLTYAEQQQLDQFAERLHA